MTLASSVPAREVVVLFCSVALMLLRTLEREAGLRPYVAMLPVMFFAIPAGIAAALHHAAEAGYDAVLTCPVDAAGLARALEEEIPRMRHLIGRTIPKPG